MAQGQFTKEETSATEDAFTELFQAFTKKQKAEFMGHANDIYLFLAAALRAAPSENDTTKH